MKDTSPSQDSFEQPLRSSSKKPVVTLPDTEQKPARAPGSARAADLGSNSPAVWSRKFLVRAVAGALVIASYCWFAFTWSVSDLNNMLLGPFGFLRRVALISSLIPIMLLRLFGILPYNQMSVSCDANSLEMLAAVFGLNVIVYVPVLYFAQYYWQRRPVDRQRDARLVSRREFLATGVCVGAGLAQLRYMRSAIEQVTVRNLTAALPGLPAQLAELRIVLLADMHRGAYTSKEYLLRVADLVNGLDPDLVCIAGDFVYHSPSCYSDITELMKAFQPRIALLGTLGNHDYWQGIDKAKAAVTSGGLRLLDNQRVFLNAQRQIVEEPPPEGLCLGGVGDMWEDSVDFAKAVQDAPSSMPRLVLSHNPDTVENRQLSECRVDLVLAGHTHGGQVVLPLIGALALPSRYGIKYLSGLSKGPYCPVYTNVGIGETVLPLRCGVKPEITLITLHAASHKASFVAS